MLNPGFSLTELCSDDLAAEGKAKIQRRRKNERKTGTGGTFENTGIFNLIML
jgi:hypothetical protein